MNALGLIIQREFSSRVKTKTFILTTLLTPLLFAAMTFLPAILMMVSDNDDIRKVYVIDQTGMYAGLFQNSKDYEFITLAADDTTKKEKTTALLQIVGDLGVNPNAATFFSEKQQPPRELTAYINNTLSEAVKNKKIDDFTTSSNIDVQLATDLQNLLKSKDKISVSTIRWDETGKETETLGEVASMVGMVLTICMFFFIMMYGQMVVQSVVEEKSNRIIEVIISSVKPFDLMMGKIIGVGLVGLLQLMVWLILGGGIMVAIQMYFGIDPNSMTSTMETQQAMAMMDNVEISKSLNEVFSINWVQVAVCMILYFIGGYLLFSSLYAMFGSAANDSQEAQQLMMPLSVILILAFYTGFAAARNPEGAMAFWCSLIPFTSPVVMMVRAPFEVPIWELVVSVVLLFITAILMVKLAAKIYRVGILMYGKKVTFAEMFKWLRYK
ncbi:ABC-2 type transport system permease protein [Dysgonomonas sp. PFB1-18]|uniref:ABC transporter permease n=1 Tax=unclassified Dysgonomonas TaxID=2630389 RepID=UPI0024760906|nr:MULTISPECIES: ABC transporter permease [unclassified Dysgonomonas]MDH6309882.1 ABC-2 type transport system permease protein [Dysgonomonas sp. PF1-14]MDH6339426.1 ABC-2 type transport system permease protein [Dysgonomonas sp. PF1-16]MDH6380925.1 ABC-2 type transport system permease protein [Dysgonomonas sp. PFB1-18]MDH6397934.1 ABC-2 type transport system permease protein [Dysgonomonas sp. PF1-23]